MSLRTSLIAALFVALLGICAGAEDAAMTQGVSPWWNPQSSAWECASSRGCADLPDAQIGESSKAGGHRLTELRNTKSHKCLQVQSWGTNNGDNVVVGSCTDHANMNQHWILEGTALKNIHSNKCLDHGHESGNGANLFVWDCNGTPNQKFKVEGSEIRSIDSNRCVDVWETNENANAKLWDCHGSVQQRWTAGVATHEAGTSWGYMKELYDLAHHVPDTNEWREAGGFYPLRNSQAKCSTNFLRILKKKNRHHDRELWKAAYESLWKDTENYDSNCKSACETWVEENLFTGSSLCHLPPAKIEQQLGWVHELVNDATKENIVLESVTYEVSKLSLCMPSCPKVNSWDPMLRSCLGECRYSHARHQKQSDCRTARRCTVLDYAVKCQVKDWGNGHFTDKYECPQNDWYREVAQKLAEDHIRTDCGFR
jgi:hypothetical protein